MIPSLTDPAFAVRRVATMSLRGRTGLRRVRVYWPKLATGPPPGLAVAFAGGGHLSAAVGGPDLLCRGLCAQAGLVVIAAGPRDGSHATGADADATVAWAADHAAELGADPGWLVLAGEGIGAGIAAAVAAGARDRGWPPIASHLLTDLPSDPGQAAGLSMLAELAAALRRDRHGIP
jgi:acetyl esterase